MLVLARLRSLLARHPAIYWLAIAVVLAVGASTAWSAGERLDAARRGWTERRVVWVATADAAPGDPLLVAARELPAAAIPASAVTVEPAGAVAVQRIGAGEVVTAADVGDGVLALLPAGWRAIAIPTEPAPPPVQVGDHVSVYADGEQLAGDGVVLGVDAGIVTVAVPAERAAAVSMAARQQTAVVALRRP